MSWIARTDRPQNRRCVPVTNGLYLSPYIIYELSDEDQFVSQYRCHVPTFDGDVEELSSQYPPAGRKMYLDVSLFEVSFIPALPFKAVHSEVVPFLSSSA